MIEELKDWELTPEDMDVALEVGAKVYIAAYDAAYQKHKAGEAVLYPNEFHIKAGAIANAAAKKVVEWLVKNNNDFSLALAENGEYDRVVLHGGLELVKADWDKLKQEVA